MVSTRNQEPTFDSSINAQNKSVRILILLFFKNVPRITVFLGFGQRRLSARGVVVVVVVFTMQKSGKADLSNMFS